MDRLRELIKKADAYIRQNRDWILIGLAIFCILSISIYMFIVKNKQKAEDYYINSPLPSEQNEDVSWSGANVAALLPKDYPNKLPIYTATPFDVDSVRNIISNFGKDSGNVSSTDETLYSWTFDGGYALYNLQSGDFIFEANGVRLGALEQLSVNTDNAIGYVRQFAEEYLNTGMDLDLGVEMRGNNYKVTGNWTIDGYGLILASSSSPSFSVQIDPNGYLLALNCMLINVEDSHNDIGIVSVPELQQYLLSSSYPKDLLFDAADNSSECTAGDCYLDPSSKIVNIVLSDLNLVYYFNPMASDNLLPTYEITGSATSIDVLENQTFVDVTVFANAVDVQRIITQ